jgi:hypothetical protein
VVTKTRRGAAASPLDLRVHRAECVARWSLGRTKAGWKIPAYPLTDHCQFDNLQIDAGWEGTLPSDQLCRREFMTLVGVATRDARAADEVAVDL